MVEEKTRPCPSCKGVMRRGVQEETVTYQGESLTYLQPGWHCENGDDGVLEGADNDYADAALHEVMARAKRSPISPLMVRAAREAVGVSQRQAGKVFGGGPTAFYKYETAKAVPSEAWPISSDWRWSALIFSPNRRAARSAFPRPRTPSSCGAPSQTIG